MQESLKRIKELHAQGKISDEEYRDLLKSVTPNPILKKLSIKILINPFSYAKGGSALIAGSIMILLFSFVASRSFVHFPATLDLRIIDSRVSNLSFWYILFQNLTIILSLTIFFYLGSVIAKAKDLRIINFLGALLLARIPYFIATLALVLLAKFFPGIQFLEKVGAPLKLNTALVVALIIIIPCLVWQCFHYFLALKYSSGLTKKWVWIVFIIAVLASEATTLSTNHFLFSPKLNIEKIDQDKLSKDAVIFATGWLKMIDQKRYSASWDQGSINFKATLSKSSWVDRIKAKKSYGKVLSRKVISTENHNEGNSGRYIQIIFKSSYQQSENLLENVTLFFENGRWKLSGYYIK